MSRHELSLADHIGRRLNDSCGHAMNHGQNTTQNYANYMSLNTMEGTEYDSGASTLLLYGEIVLPGALRIDPTSITDAYPHRPKLKLLPEVKGSLWKWSDQRREGDKKKKQKKPKPQIKRSGSLDNGGFLLKMVFPISLGTNKKKNKKKNDCDTNKNCKLSPKPTVLDASGKSVDKEWWKKRSGSNESESGGSTINSGSTRSIRSSSTSSSSSSCRSISNSSRSHKRGGCLAFILARKAKSSR
ncbi:hypothetical protein CXB51_008211 [Gossypium anomalum]|uniref:Uncharacterized protein n=1 Tax=Gossypium anomalum TaxID=47600 RepID=A0A8J5YZQ5_9ROSI|nr:hypothetical protein CXB51_008211 [Gossypium anomalum]